MNPKKDAASVEKIQLIDVCDQGADTFEFLEHEVFSSTVLDLPLVYVQGSQSVTLFPMV